MKKEKMIEIDPKDEEGRLKEVRELLKDITNIDPDKAVCLLGVVVTRDESEGQDGFGIHHFAFGDEDDMSHMLVAIAQHLQRRLSDRGAMSNIEIREITLKESEDDSSESSDQSDYETTPKVIH